MKHQVSTEYTEAQSTTSPLAAQSSTGYPDLFLGGKDISNVLFVLLGNKSKFQNFKTLTPWHGVKNSLKHECEED